MRHAFGAFVLVAMMVGCKGSDPDFPSGASFPPVGAPAKVEIVAPGAQPRVLRFVAEANTTRKIRAVVESSMKAAGTDQQGDVGLVLDLALATSIVRVDPDGTFTLKTAIEKARAKLGGTLAQELPDAAKGALGELIENQTMTLVVGANGALKSIDATGLDDPGFGQWQAGIDQTMRGGVVALPDGPVGVGARWDAFATIDLLGIHVRLMTRYTLRDLQGHKAVLGLGFIGRADDQDMAMEGARAHLDHLRLEGSGELEIDLHQPAWAKATLDFAVDLDLVAEGERGRGTLRTKIAMTPDD